MAKKLSTEEFIERAKAIHKDKYDYSLSNYKGYDVPVIIICKSHGEFKMTPHHHIGVGGRSCGKCLMIQDTDTFIERAKETHGTKYNYSESVYTGSRNKVKIICPSHGAFYQRATSHTSGTNCPHCAIEKSAKINTKTTSDYIKEIKCIHKERYDYSKIKYEHSNKPIEVICKEHGSFFPSASNFLRGTGCPNCKESVLETKTKNFLIKHNITFEEQKTFDWLIYKSNQYLDFYLPDYNIAIECQGEQHFYPVAFKNTQDKHEDFEYCKLRDDNKLKLCLNHNINILYYTNVSRKVQENVSYQCFNNYDDLLMKLNSIKKELESENTAK